jgi:hypothetical protein
MRYFSLLFAVMILVGTCRGQQAATGPYPVTISFTGTLDLNQSHPPEGFDLSQFDTHIKGTWTAVDTNTAGSPPTSTTMSYALTSFRGIAGSYNFSIGPGASNEEIVYANDPGNASAVQVYGNNIVAGSLPGFSLTQAFIDLVGPLGQLTSTALPISLNLSDFTIQHTLALDFFAPNFGCGGFGQVTYQIDSLTTCAPVPACGSSSAGSSIGCVKAYPYDVAYERAEFYVNPDLDTAAKLCGFNKYFNWQQMFTTLPCGSPFRPADPSRIPTENSCPDHSLTASPSTPLFDPPPGSWTYYGNDPYPLHYPSSWVLPNSGHCSFLPGYCSPPYVFPNIATNNILSFIDAPNDEALKGVPASSDPPPGSFVAFKNMLVGVSDNTDQGGVICDPTGKTTPVIYCTPLFSWTWNSTYDGKTVGSGVSQTASLYPILPGSGTGGVTITGINSVQLPLAVPSGQITSIASGLAYSRVSQTFNGTVTIRNVSSSAISGPLQILFFGMPGTATLMNATGNLSGLPYVTVPAVASLTPGQSARISVQFKNPSNAVINFTPVVYSGSIN